MQQVTCEEMIEELKRQYPTFRFKAGTVGFGVFYQHHFATFPYTVFKNPQFPDMFARQLTAMEVLPCPCGNDHDFDLDDDLDFSDARPRSAD